MFDKAEDETGLSFASSKFAAARPSCRSLAGRLLLPFLLVVLTACDHGHTSMSLSEHERTVPPASSTVTIFIVNSQHSDVCVASAQNRANAASSPNGTIWTRVAPSNWCEHRGRQLVRYWREVPRSEATRALILRGGQAFLGYPAAVIENVEPVSAGACRDPLLVRSMQATVPAFANLQLCQRASTARHRLTYSLVRTTSGLLPVMSFDPIESARATVVYVPGGPYVNPFAELNDTQMLNMITSDPRLRTVIPLYLGTYPLRVDGTDNFAIAQSQIAEFVATERQDWPDIGLCLVGGSLGGYLLGTISLPAGTPALLVSPLLESPQQAISRISEEEDFEDPVVQLRAVSAVEWRTAAIRPASAAAQGVSRSSAFLTYFGGHKDVSLVDRASRSHANLMVIYGSHDRSIGLGSSQNLISALGQHRVQSVGQVGHHFERSESFWAFEPFVREFLAGCAPSSPS